MIIIRAIDDCNMNNGHQQHPPVLNGLYAQEGYEPMAIERIWRRLATLLEELPTIPPELASLSSEQPAGFAAAPLENAAAEDARTRRRNHQLLRSWAESTMEIVDEYSLLLACLSTVAFSPLAEATGAAMGQRTAHLAGAILTTQVQIDFHLKPRLSRVLYPSTSVRLASTVTTTTTRTEEQVPSASPPGAAAQQRTTVETTRYSYEVAAEDERLLSRHYHELRITAPVVRELLAGSLHSFTESLVAFMVARAQQRQNENQAP